VALPRTNAGKKSCPAKIFDVTFGTCPDGEIIFVTGLSAFFAHAF
jgi:hypothetical protein